MDKFLKNKDELRITGLQSLSAEWFNTLINYFTSDNISYVNLYLQPYTIYLISYINKGI